MTHFKIIWPLPHPHKGRCNFPRSSSSGQHLQWPPKLTDTQLQLLWGNSGRMANSAFSCLALCFNGVSSSTHQWDSEKFILSPIARHLVTPKWPIQQTSNFKLFFETKDTNIKKMDLFSKLSCYNLFSFIKTFEFNFIGRSGIYARRIAWITKLDSVRKKTFLLPT